MYASGYAYVDLVLTTREFARLIKASGIDFLRLEDEVADSPIGAYSGAGTIFETPVSYEHIRTAYNYDRRRS